MIQLITVVFVETEIFPATLFGFFIFVNDFEDLVVAAEKLRDRGLHVYHYLVARGCASPKTDSYRRLARAENTVGQKAVIWRPQFPCGVL